METTIVKKLRANIEADYDAQSPNDWDNDDVFLVYDHRDFYVKRAGFDPEAIYDHIVSTHKLEELKEKYSLLLETEEFEEEVCELERDIDSTYNNYHIFPLYAYIHSGVSLSLGNTGYPFNCRFDTSMRGFVLVNKEENIWIKNEDGKNFYEQKIVDIEKAKKYAQGLVDEWNMYLSGDVWYISLEEVEYEQDEDGDLVEINSENLESIGGHYGWEFAKDELESLIKAYNTEDLEVERLFEK